MRSKGVLVVEDDDNSADLLATFARSEGFVASVAAAHAASARQQRRRDTAGPRSTPRSTWRTSSARLREFRLLAEVMSEAAEKFLGKLRD